jgi:hypothetical protein
MTTASEKMLQQLFTVAVQAAVVVDLDEKNRDDKAMYPVAMKELRGAVDRWRALMEDEKSARGDMWD